jgi:hypothetical protein
VPSDGEIFSIQPDLENARSAAERLFAEIMPRLREFLPQSADIRHVGATARPVLAATKTQAANAFRFISGAIDASPALRSLIVGSTADTLSLATNVEIVVRPASFRSIRGATFVAAILDEVAFWRTDDGSTNPDVEIVRALRPGLLLSKGPLVAISSPFAKKGYLWNTYRKNFGVDGNPKILVAQASSEVMNCNVDMDWIADQLRIPSRRRPNMVHNSAMIFQHSLTAKLLTRV